MRCGLPVQVGIFDADAARLERGPDPPDIFESNMPEDEDTHENSLWEHFTLFRSETAAAAGKIYGWFLAT